MKIRSLGLIFLFVVCAYAPVATAQSEPLLGQIAWVPYNFVPRGWAECNGQLLPINQNAALYSLLGTSFGGDGRTTFALPDLRGRVLVHIGQGLGLTARTLGGTGGLESVALTENQMPLHTHIQGAHDHTIGAHTHDISNHIHTVGDHSHSIPAQAVQIRATSASATTTSPSGNVLAKAVLSASSVGAKVTNIYDSGPADVALGASASTVAGTTGAAGAGNTSEGGAGSSSAAVGGSTGSAQPPIGTAGGSLPHENMQPWLGLRCIIATEGIFPSRD